MEPTERVVKVAVSGRTVSLEAVDAPLDQVLVEVGRSLHARIIVETVLADDLRVFSGGTTGFRDLTAAPDADGPPAAL